MIQHPTDALRAYVRAFESLDPDAVASCYDLPSVFIAPPGVTVVADAESARAMASRLIEHAKSQDYRRSEILEPDVRMLGESLAAVSGVFVRFNSIGVETSRFGFAYTMRKNADRWGIVVALAHELPTAER